MKTNYLLYFSLLILISSCKDFIEKDITGKTPTMLFPVEGDTVAQSIQFKWLPTDGATKYRLEIYYPNFTSPTAILLDSVINNTDFYIQLTPNHYQYKLTALNNGYISQSLGPINFFVDTVQGGNNNITLNYPTGGIYKNGSFDGKFSWQDLPNELSYEFSLRKGTDFATGEILVSMNQLSSTQYTTQSYTYTEANYIWGVKAYFPGGGQSNFYTGTFKIDTTRPVTPSLNLPADLTSGTSPISFSWNIGTDVGVIQSPVYSFLQISQVNDFSSITSLDSTNNNTLTKTLSTSGIYYWRVFNKDQAGNNGFYSTTRQITVN